ncbi:cation:proton antiporter [Candidatus Phycosocius spiralis]|uniref:Potassium transporter TrkA n=1 Tax=Candidatus Phycosocius spiralis TaxID=2815099 RepID=A0ABQ4PUR8_9PROT|nr:cation:proton antiporter [Candidatus Phycosocius spiralis]GIU66721.1 potassium transporter TrkA [Candidatus Phycosocius spiralis]
MATFIDIAAFKEPVIILSAAAIVVPLFHRFKISPVLGFILCGILLGPSGLGGLVDNVPWLSAFTIQDRASIATMAEFGIVFLLFAIGLELSFERLNLMRKVVFGLGSVQIVISALVIGGFCYFALRISGVSAGVLGIALALSSTAIVLQTLAEQKRLSSATGRGAFGVLLFQDLAVVPILFALSMLAPDRLGLGTFGLIQSLVVALLAVVFTIVVGRLVLRPLFRQAARTKSPEIFMAACLLVVIATSLGSAAAGLSMALGAFVAGLLLAETEYRREVETTIEPFKGLLLGVFLVSIGMSVDSAKIFERPLEIALSILGLIGVKTAIIAGFAPFFGIKRASAFKAGLMLGPGGEFAFVVLGLAVTEKLISPDQADFALLVGAASMCLIPLLANYSLAPTGHKPSQNDSEFKLASEASQSEQPHVIVAGYGRVGMVSVDLLAEHTIPYVAIDSDLDRVQRARKMGRKVYFGDASRGEFLRACGIDRARALVVTMDGGAAVDQVVKAARLEQPDLPIVARSRDGAHAVHLYSLGVREAVPEALEASLQVGEAILVEAGVPMGQILVAIHNKRASMRAALLEASTAATPSERMRVLRDQHLQAMSRVGKQ